MNAFAIRRSLFIISAVLSLAAAVALPACKDANLNVDPAETKGSDRLSSDDTTFFAKAGQAGMVEMQAATLAGERSKADDVKTFASMISTDHSANNKMLQALAAKKSVSLPTALDRDHQAMLDSLRKKSPEDFDKAYASAMKDGHEKAVDLFSEVSEDSKDADISGFAKTSLPTLEHHLELAKTLSSAH